MDLWLVCAHSVKLVDTIIVYTENHKSTFLLPPDHGNLQLCVQMELGTKLILWKIDDGPELFRWSKSPVNQCLGQMSQMHDSTQWAVFKMST